MLSLGLMSGTSGDGVSLALVEVIGKRLRVRAHRTYPYIRSLRARLWKAGESSPSELACLNMELGGLWSRRVLDFLRRQGVTPAKVAVLGSHGQTVVHLPGRASLQIGEAAVLAEKTGITVVADFRPRDIAAGGQGAPLVPFFDNYFFGGGPCRAVQNLGGLANVSVVGRGVRPMGFDTGPGNCLMDLAVTRLTRGRRSFDKDGRLAGRGRVHHAVASSALSHPFFSRRPPKSADRALFGEAFLRPFERAIRRPEDLLATLAYFTATTIRQAYERFLFPRYPVREVLLSGGGALNPVVVGFLKEMLPRPVLLPEQYGLPAQAKEAACFALMAALALQGKTNHLAEPTGARGPRLLGKIVPA